MAVKTTSALVNLPENSPEATVKDALGESICGTTTYRSLPPLIFNHALRPSSFEHGAGRDSVIDHEMLFLLSYKANFLGEIGAQ